MTPAARMSAANAIDGATRVLNDYARYLTDEAKLAIAERIARAMAELREGEARK